MGIVTASNDTIINTAPNFGLSTKQGTLSNLEKIAKVSNSIDILKRNLNKSLLQSDVKEAGYSRDLSSRFQDAHKYETHRRERKFLESTFQTLNRHSHSKYIEINKPLADVLPSDVIETVFFPGRHTLIFGYNSSFVHPRHYSATCYYDENQNIIIFQDDNDIVNVHLKDNGYVDKIEMLLRSQIDPSYSTNLMSVLKRNLLTLDSIETIDNSGQNLKQILKHRVSQIYSHPINDFANQPETKRKKSYSSVDSLNDFYSSDFFTDMPDFISSSGMNKPLRDFLSHNLIEKIFAYDHPVVGLYCPDYVGECYYDKEHNVVCFGNSSYVITLCLDDENNIFRKNHFMVNSQKNSYFQEMEIFNRAKLFNY